MVRRIGELESAIKNTDTGTFGASLLEDKAQVNSASVERLCSSVQICLCV